MKVQFNRYYGEEITTNLKCKCVEYIERDFRKDDIEVYECETNNIEEITKRYGALTYKAVDGFEFKDGNETKFCINTWEEINN